MNLFGIGIEPIMSGNSTMMTRGRADSKGDEAGAAEDPLDLPRDRNMLAGNFVGGRSSLSNYAERMLDGLKAQEDFGNRLRSVVSGQRSVLELMAKVEDVSPSEKNLLGQKAAEAVKDVIEDEVSDQSENTLEAMREDVDERVEEATQSESEAVLEDDTSQTEALEESLSEASSGESGSAVEELAIADQPALAAEAAEAAGMADDAAGTAETEGGADSVNSAMSPGATIDLVV